MRYSSLPRTPENIIPTIFPKKKWSLHKVGNYTILTIGVKKSNSKKVIHLRLRCVPQRC